MKPIKLEIEGLNSFSSKQTIDFSSVLKEGIFGIFGNTGSGKSTILDAIVLALYGKTQKNNKKQEFVNCNSKKAVVSFVFEILYNGRRRIFEFYREFYPTDRNGVATAYEYEGDKKLMLAEKSDGVNSLAEEIVGLEFEDFKKCIALPQGEFDRFTKAKKSERLDIMARLFSLEKYGQKLYDGATARYNILEKERVANEAELHAYEDYTDEIYNSYLVQFNEKNKRLDEVQSALEKDDKQFEELDKLRNLSKEVEDLEAKFIAVEKEVGKNAEKQQALEKTDFAEKYIEYYENINKSNVELEKIKRRLDDSNIQLKRFEDLLEEYKKDGFEQDYNVQKNSLIAKKTEIETLKDSFDEKLVLESQINDKLCEYRETETANKTLEKQQEKNEELLNINIELQSRLGNSDADDYIDGICKNAVHSEYVYLDEQNNKNGNIEWLAEIIGRKLAENESVVSGFSIDEEKENIKKRKQLKDAENTINKEISELKTAIAVNKEKLEKLKNDGTDLRTRLNKLNQKIDLVTSGKDYRVLTKEVQNAIDNLERQKTVRDNKITTANEKIREFSVLKTSCSVEIENLKNKITENTEKIKEISAVCGIIDIIVARKFALTEAEKRQYADDLKKTSDSFAVIKATLEEKKGQLAGRTFDDETYQTLSLKIKNQSGEADELKRDIAVTESKINICKEKLAKKKLLIATLNEVTDKCETVKRLQTLFKGRAFLEYVADEYLVEITYSASTTLMKLTSGRYSLKYNQEFFVCDNVNGGKERTVNTLSGGETFLVSLSLAFALSTAICSKSDRPIEFFFLDEGFGTLDDELVEVVLSSLEKFKNSHFSIGIISHVKELKERINCKINVTGATDEKGSTISVTC